jgi:uncharacterized membrane protein (Fun14 family)
MEDLTARLTSFILPLLPGLVAGYLLGRLARKAFSTALFIALGMAVVVLALALFGADVSFVRDWLETGSAWAGEKLSGARQYLAALLPPLAALGIGFKIGLGKR